MKKIIKNSERSRTTNELNELKKTVLILKKEIQEFKDNQILAQSVLIKETHFREEYLFNIILTIGRLIISPTILQQEMLNLIENVDYFSKISGLGNVSNKKVFLKN